MVIISGCHCQYFIDQPPDDAFNISVGRTKKGIISVDILARHPTVEGISLFDITMESIYRIQVIKTRVFFVLFVAVPDNTVHDPRKCMVTAQAVAEGECPICDMSFKDADKLFCTLFCPVDSDSKCITFALDACADTYIFIGNTSLFCFGTVSAWPSGNRTVQLPSLIAVKDKGLIKL